MSSFLYVVLRNLQIPCNFDKWYKGMLVMECGIVVGDLEVNFVVILVTAATELLGQFAREKLPGSFNKCASPWYRSVLVPCQTMCGFKKEATWLIC